MKKNKKRNIGAPPGSIVYSGYETTERIKITLIEYNEEEFFEKEFYDLSECISHVKPNLVKWINVEGVHLPEILEQLGKLYNIHPLTLEDIAHVDQRPKFEDYENYVVAIMKMISFDKKIMAEQLSIVLFENMVITFQEPQGGDAFDVIRTRLRQAKGRIRKCGAII